MAEVWVTLAAAGIAAGATVYATNQKGKAAEKNAAQVQQGTQPLGEPTLLGAPNQIDLRQLSQDSVDIPYDKLEYASRLARSVNRVNYGEAMRYYRKIQPFFDQIQRQVGSNALSFARGELPSDVVGSIGRAAAERGVQGGFGFGTQGGKTGALANLNLRNLGLTSLDLARYGTETGMRVNQQAKALLPNLASPTDYLLTPQQILGATGQNVGFQNDFRVRDNALINQTNAQNTGLANSLNQSIANMGYTASVDKATGYAQAGQAIAGAIAQNAGSFSSTGGSYNPASDPSIGHDAAGYYRINTNSNTSPNLLSARPNTLA